MQQQELERRRRVCYNSIVLTEHENCFENIFDVFLIGKRGMSCGEDIIQKRTLLVYLPGVIPRLAGEWALNISVPSPVRGPYFQSAHRVTLQRWKLTLF